MHKLPDMMFLLITRLFKERRGSLVHIISAKNNVDIGLIKGEKRAPAL